MVGKDYRHSHLTLRLRAEVVESTLLYDADLAYMVGVAALHSHDKADVEKGSETVSGLYYTALSRLPYLTKGRTGKDMIHASREAAIERYRDMKRRALKPVTEDNV